MIDLSTCTPGQKVKYRNGKIGVFNGRTDLEKFPYRTITDNGSYTLAPWHMINGNHRSGSEHEYDVVKILPVETPEEQPMIDLSTCVPGQQVKYLCGEYGEYVGPIDGDFPRFSTENINGYLLQHTQSGSVPLAASSFPYHVVEILPVETPKEQPTPTPQEMDYKTAYNEIGSIISVAFPECEVTTVDMARLLVYENRTLRMALGLPSYKRVSDAIYEEEERV